MIELITLGLLIWSVVAFPVAALVIFWYYCQKRERLDAEERRRLRGPRDGIGGP